MASTYQYRAQTQVLSGGYTGEAIGVTPAGTSWQTGNSGQAYPAVTYEYWFSDSNSGDNNNSSRVIISATDNWTATIDSQNVLTVKVHTVINSIVRRIHAGNPLKGGNYTRDITVSRSKGGKAVFTKNADPIGRNATLSGKIDLGTETFTLQPGSSVTRGSLYVLSHTSGFPWTTIYTDEMYAGISFKNTLPAIDPSQPVIDKDYRPGANWNGSSWQSHNRNGGAAYIYNGTRWGEMRTESGPDYENQPATGNPPSIYTGPNKRNMFNIGANRWPEGDPYLEKDKS